LGVTVLIALTTAAPAYALAPPLADPAALPADGPPGPDQPMDQRGPCVTFAPMPGFDPVAVPPSSEPLNLPEAWKSSRGAGQIVAVIDTGVTPQPRLRNLIPGGDYIQAGADGLTDCDGHGTAVAGLIAGEPGPDGFSGVATGAQILSIRQSSAAWSPKAPTGDPQTARTAGSVATLARAVVHAANLGARVINISVINCTSVHRNVDQAALGAALRYAVFDKDAIVIAAAGNDGEDRCASNPLPDPALPGDPRNWGAATTVSTPSWWQPYVLSVGSLTPAGQPSGFTMAGPWVGVAAPGEHIVSLGNAAGGGLINGQPSDKEPLVSINGTSYAAAYVSGVAALIRAKFPMLTAYQVINRIVASAHNSARAASTVVGTGVIDPVAALTWEIPAGAPTPAAQTVAVAPPPAPPPDDSAPRLVAFAVAAAAAATVAAVAILTAVRRRRGDTP
jgi:membrane-anchored mycosin MYCP